MKHVLVTGANGLVGRRLCQWLLDHGWTVTAAVRRPSAVHQTPDACRTICVGPFERVANWRRWLSPEMRVVHLAARTHHTNEAPHGLERLYRETNVEGTRRLLDECCRVGVQRFVFVSSIKAVGEGQATAYTETTPCRPETAYGVTKQAAEELVRRESDAAGVPWVVVRPPLVYGPGTRGHLEQLMRWIVRGLPVPIPRSENARSLIALDALVDALQRCLEHPAAINQTYHVADQAPVSVARMVDCLARGMQRPTRMIRMPKSWLVGLARAGGRSEAVQRWTGSLTVSCEKIQQQTGWSSKFNTQRALVELGSRFAQPAHGRSASHHLLRSLRS